jgi:hypothetical protein
MTAVAAKRCKGESSEVGEVGFEVTGEGGQDEPSVLTHQG